eukprot:scaffold1580_cov116-Cylindrotheca_fusiformis.AAC.8
MTSDDDLYQISFDVEDVGGHIKASKKKITWVFEIDGQERSVTFTWSKQSGKQEITDGDTVLSDSKNGSFYFRKWASSGGLQLHILGTVHTPGKGNVANEFRKYELIINGNPFSRLPKKDGTPAAKKEGKLPEGIYDVIYPRGYENHFARAEAPLKSRKQLEKKVKKNLAAEA